ncbi:unnamed protein product [Somion occarium]|uniref:Cytochrome P450 n=1 Tax=Somion occarium TaxID=3059160 RepID=A0ABP1DHD1_9APHY
MSLSVTWTALVVALTWVIYRLSKVGSREHGLPPGPPTVPLLGNIHVFETRRPYLKLTEWAKTWGDIYSLKFGSATGVVISSPKLAREYVDLHGATTSDRPPVYVDELISGGLELPLTHYGDEWRLMRRAAHDMISREACNRHLPIQQAEASQLMFDLVGSPEKFYTHLYRYTASVITSVIYGIHCNEYDNTFVEKFDKFTQRLEAALMPGNSPPVDMFPILKYIPEFLAPWKVRCKEVRRDQREIFFGLLDLVIERIENGKTNECFMEYVVERKEHYELDRELLGYLGGSLLQAGIDTTAFFLQNFILCMLIYPHVMKRAQEEIDKVIGHDRSPEFADFEDLPYLKAVVNEVHRFCPTAPLAIPHASTTEQRMGDYMIPKDAIIFVNSWGMYRHEDYYENPDVFDPDRYVKHELGIKAGIDPTGVRNDFAFGMGRRRCPGSILANNSIAINTMNLLWAFDFKKAKDPVTGQVIEVSLENTKREAILLVPTPYKCDIIPRSESKANLIRAQFAAARETFELFEHHIIEIK